MYSLLKKIIIYFRTVEIFEIKSNSSYNIPKNYKFKIYKNFSSIRSKDILEYFNIYKKKKRFSSRLSFLTLSYKKKLVSSGWLYSGKKWKITEIDKEIKIFNKIVIFDFITPFKFRNKGHYTKLLKIIKRKFRKKNILIYVLSSNLRSKKAIKKAGFNLIKKLRKI